MKRSWLLLSMLLVALAAPVQDEVTPLSGDVNIDNEVNIADANIVCPAHASAKPHHAANKIAPKYAWKRVINCPKWPKY